VTYTPSKTPKSRRFRSNPKERKTEEEEEHEEMGNCWGSEEEPDAPLNKSTTPPASGICMC